MISLDNARKWSKKAADRRDSKLLEKWIVNIGDDWVQTFRDKMEQAALNAVNEGWFKADVSISSPAYDSSQELDKWQAFIRPDLEKILQEYEALGFEDGAMEGVSVERNIKFSGSYYVNVYWCFRKRKPNFQRVRYA